MRYLDIKLIETKLQENTDSNTVIVLYINGDRYEITNISKSHMDHPGFADAILKMAEKKFPNKEFKTFYIVGTDGKRVDGYDFETLKTDEVDPDGVPDKKSDDETDDVGDIEPPKTSDGEEDDDNETDDEPASIGVQTATLKDLANQQNAYADSVDKDRDNKHDETGELVRRMNDQGKYVDAEGNLLGSQLPDINLPGSGEPLEVGLTAAEKINGTLPSSTDADGGSGTDAQGEISKAFAKRLYDAARPRELGIKADIMGTNEAEILKVYKQFKTYEDYARVMIAYREEYDENWPMKLLQELSLATPDFDFTVADKQNMELISKELVRLGILPLYAGRKGKVSYKEPDPEPYTFDKPNGLDNEANELTKEGDPIVFYWEGKKYFLIPENNDGKFDASVSMTQAGNNSGDYDRRITPKGDLLNKINQEIERRKEAWSDKPNGIYTEQPIAYGRTGDGRVPLVIVIWEGERYYVDPSKPLEDGGYRGGQIMGGKVQFNDSATDPNLVKEIDEFVKNNPDKFEEQ